MRLLNQLAHQIEKGNETIIEKCSRRAWLKDLGLFSASGIALAACGIQTEQKRTVRTSGGMLPDIARNISDGPKEENPEESAIADGKLLNAALALEHEAIVLYTAAAGLDFMNEDEIAPVLAIAKTFAQHHVEHSRSLIGAINNLQSKFGSVEQPVEALPDSEYLKPQVISKLTDVVQVVRLASLKEMEAAKAYLSLISSFNDRNLAQVSGMLGGDEAGHYGVLRAALFAVLGDATLSPEKVIPSSLPGGWNQEF
jgi:rubrerythrin